MLAKLKPLDLAEQRIAQAAELNALYGERSAEEIIEIAANQEFAGHIAAVSSFGADSAVLLNLIAAGRPQPAGSVSRHRQAFRGDARLSRCAGHRFRPA